MHYLPIRSIDKIDKFYHVLSRLPQIPVWGQNFLPLEFQRDSNVFDNFD